MDSTFATYTYSGPLRVKKVLNSQGTSTRVYIYSGSKVIAEYWDGALAREYIYLGNQLLYTVRIGDTDTYHHFDHLSQRVATNSSGTVQYGNNHYPFGEGGGTDQWAFTTYQRDESGLDQAVFRYYSPRVGRFMSADPLSGHLRAPQSLNRYAYVGNDPVNLWDPLGLCDYFICVDVWEPYDRGFFASGGSYRAPLLDTGAEGGGGGGGEGRSATSKVLCSFVPEGRTTGLTGSVGAVGGQQGSIEVVLNYNTGEISGFAAGGLQAGFSGFLQGAAQTGFIYGLGESNRNYSGGFTGGSASVGNAGIYTNLSSGGLNQPSRINLTGPNVVGVSLGKSLVGPGTVNASATHYSTPVPLGNLKQGNPLASPVDYLFFALRQLCR